MIFLGILHFPGFSQDLSSHLLITGLESAGPPAYHSESDSLIFTYQAQRDRFQPRYVGIAFEHEDFVPVYELQYFDTRDDEGLLLSRVYYHFLPIDETIETLNTLHYRYIVDGIWISDPKNPRSIQKFSGRKLSVAEIPVERSVLPENPVIINDDNLLAKMVHFVYHADSGEEVFLAGSFNNWDPFMYSMNEHPANPGRYEIRIRLLPGNYQYNYYYRGRRVKDPLNVQSSYDIEGYEYSFFSIES